MSKSPSISACFPAFNEEGSVQEVVRDAYRVLQDLSDDFEVIVCDDGSTDGTPGELSALAAELPALRILRNEPNRGLAYTFERLYREASKDLVFLNATDGQWPNAILREMLPLAAENDLVVSVRRNKNYGLFRSVVSAVYNFLPVLAFGINPRDAGGVKLVARRFLYVGALVSTSPFADAERYIRAVRDGARVSFVPVTTQVRRRGRSHAVSARVLLRCLLDFFRLRLALWKEPRTRVVNRSRTS